MADAMKLVPVEPTEAMMDAFWRGEGESGEMRARSHARGKRQWSAMLAASPPAREEAPDDGALIGQIEALLAIQNPSHPLPGLARQLLNRAVTALRNRTSEPEAGAVGWWPMRTAPKDGTEIETLCVHPTAHYSTDAFGEGWADVVKARWIDHNGGGWTWHGLSGVHMAWRPVTHPAPATADKLRTAVEALEGARGHTQLTHVYAGIDVALAALNEGGK